MMWRRFVLGAGIALWSAAVMAQQQPWPAQDTVQQRWPDENPAAQAPPAGARTRAAPRQDTTIMIEEDAPAAKKQESKAAATPRQPRAVTCGGAFAKESNHLKLATLFGAQNVTFTDVDGPDGTKLKASVLFPKDPARRLEVMWENEASRSDTAVVAINGRSAWAAPKGLRLGLTLAALEKLNRKPFKLTGFGPDSTASVEDWQGGELASLPGGCKVGIRFTMDSKAADSAREPVAGASKAFMSSDAAMRAVTPKIAEILIGY